MKIESITNMNITEITSRIANSTQDIYTIAISGGTASGKSWLSTHLEQWCVDNGYDTVILHQDDFALGKIFPLKHASPYKWDDPENYRLDEAYSVLQDFIKGDESRSFLAYTLESHRPIAESRLKWKQALRPNGRRIVIIEGLYPWREPFDNLVDLRVFVDVNFYHRYILRLHRNVLVSKVTTFEKVTEQYFSFVARAHKDLLEPLKSSANVVISNTSAIEQAIHHMPINTAKTPLPNYIEIYADNILTIHKVDDENNHIIEIASDKGIIFQESVSSEVSSLVKSNI